MHYTYLNKQLIPGNKYLFYTRIYDKNKMKKFTGTFIDIRCGTLRVEDYYDGKFASCDVIFWTTPLEFITDFRPVANINAIFNSKQKIQT